MNELQTRAATKADVGLTCIAILIWAVLFGAVMAHAGGTLTPEGSPDQPVRIVDHHVNVVLNNGFARTEVLQTFFNPNDVDVEAIYSFPIPRSASLSEMTIYAGEQELHGEVLSEEDADRIYGEERDKGNDAGLAQKSSYQTFDFFVSFVPALAETRLRFVYYEPLEIDTGVGRYVYPLQDGGTDEVGASFWAKNEQVDGTFSAEIELKTAWPVTDVRVPGYEAAALIDQIDDGHYRVRIETKNASLNRDLVFYYRLEDNLPGRVELIPYRADPNEPGTFMLIVTPGLDLQPLSHGADYVFVLDVSGSMEGKIQTLARGVCKVLGQMGGQDRFRVILFNGCAREMTPGWVTATQENTRQTIAEVEQLRAGGGTNLYDAVRMALGDLDDDRATSVVLVTDAVTNTGIIEPQAFHDLLSRCDVRFFGFLMGNNANWPLMRLISETSGGFYASVSNADDIIGQIMLAKGKVLYECLHDAELSIGGVKAYDMTDGYVDKVYRGQQLVLFGRYAEGGAATVSLDARLTGTDKMYTTSFEFPDVDTENPEIERLWALNRIEAIEMEALLGVSSPAETEDAIEDLGIEYQLVTDHTSMVVLSDAAFEEYGIERRNRARTEVEHQAQSERKSQPVRSRRVDTSRPMFDQPAPAPGGGGGGGAIDPVTGGLVLALGGGAFVAQWRQRARRVGKSR